MSNIWRECESVSGVFASVQFSYDVVNTHCAYPFRLAITTWVPISADPGNLGDMTISVRQHSVFDFVWSCFR